jgi:hypothetical protein
MSVNRIDLEQSFLEALMKPVNNNRTYARFLLTHKNHPDKTS